MTNEYKTILWLWYKGTGGRSSDHKLFESWDQEKLDEYDINPVVYDHTNITERPPLLIEGYTKQKKYLTSIFMGP